MKTTAFLLFFALTTSVYASNGDKGEVKPITMFHKIWDDLDDNPKYTDKFSVYFSKYDKLYCDPAKIEESKIEAASKCDPSINFPIAHKCAEETYKARKIMTWSERRKTECAMGPTFDDIEREIKLCISKESKAQNFTIPEPISPEEIKTKTKDEIAEKAFSIIGEIHTCFGKTLA